MQPLVTIIVPTLNRTKYLRESLKAVLGQDYPNLAILVSDNGSTDDTPVVARALTSGDSRVRFRRNEATVPIYEHFNQCLRAVRGEWYLIACDDDAISLNCVSECMAVVHRHPSMHVVLPACVTMDEAGSTLTTFARPAGERLDSIEFVKHWLNEKSPPYFACLATMLTRTETVRRFGGYQAFARGQNIDNLLFIQCAVSGPVGFAGDATFKWRIYQHSYGSVSDPKLVGRSSYQLVRHLRTDPETIAALAALSPAERTSVVDGARLLSTRAFLYCIRFYDEPLTAFRRRFDFPFDPQFYRLVAGFYLRYFKARVQARGVKPSNEPTRRSTVSTE